MVDIFTIIGLSSLIASVVTVILGILRDVLVERYRFKKQHETEFLQNQIETCSRIYVLLQRWDKGAWTTDLWGGTTTAENWRQMNEIVKERPHMFDSRILNEWLNFMAMFEKFVGETEKSKDYIKQMMKQEAKLRATIREIMNKELLPKYRKIVGKTLPDLE